MREKTYELLQQGYDKEDVITYMTDRYGQFITYSPTLTMTTLFLWLMPICVLLLGCFVVLFGAGKVNRLHFHRMKKHVCVK